MGIERAAAGSSLIDVLDRVLDKGIVIDAWVRVSLVGIDLLTLEARVVVASIATYRQNWEPVDSVPSLATPPAVDGTSKLVGRRLPVPPRPPSMLS
jgi:gas vesicle structural protein